MPPIRFANPYGTLAKETIYEVDPGKKELRPFDSGEAYQGAGYQFGQERLADPREFEGYAVGAPISRAQQLDGVKSELNALQDSLYNTDIAANKRRSKKIDEDITDALAEMETERAEFNSLRNKYNEADGFSLYQEFEKLRRSAGVPGIESDLLNKRAERRELPYKERAATGNAGVATEDQLAAQTEQKDIPLFIQESNLIDRLKLASDYVSKAIGLKESDANRSRANLEKALSLTQDAMSSIQTRVSNLSTIRSQIQTQIANGMDTHQALINTLTTSGALSKLPANDLAVLEMEAGFPRGSLKAIKDSVKPQDKLLTSATNDNGDLTMVFQSPQGVVSTHTIPGIGATKSKSGDGAGGLTPAQINATVNGIANAFDTEPIVKEYNTIAAQLSFLNTAGDTPTDDISRVYAFAKIMDPNSVVREGEYKTVQEYSQALLQQTGLKAKRIFKNDGFLTNEAREFMNNTLQRRLAVAEGQYNQVKSEYQRQIDDAYAGKARTITQYSVTPPAPQSGGATQETDQGAQNNSEPEGFWKKAMNWLWGD